MKSTKRIALFLLLPLLLLAPLLFMAGGIKGLLRGLTTNVAVTTPDSPDASLHPVVTTASTDTIDSTIQQLCDQSSQWQQPKTTQPLPQDSPLYAALPGDKLAELRTWHLVHASGLIGFKDDVWLIAQPTGEQLTLWAHSQSRLGKGDLGQNPRNLRALHQELVKRL